MTLQWMANFFFISFLGLLVFHIISVLAKSDLVPLWPVLVVLGLLIGTIALAGKK